MSQGFPKVAIAKMSGAGNDFLVIGPDERTLLGDRFVSWIRAVCLRGISVGADGVLVVEPAGGNRVGVEFRNPDGTPAFCGNGTRCGIRYAHRRGWVDECGIASTAAGEVPFEISLERVALRLPPPVDRGRMTLEVASGPVDGRLVVAGVAHFVLETEDLDGYPLSTIGPLLRFHPALGPEGANVSVIARDRPGRLRIRTWERGVEGETLACGSGAVAAAAVARYEGGPSRIEILPRSGIPLSVFFPDPAGSPAFAELEGEARFVLDGVVGPETAPAVGP